MAKADLQGAWERLEECLLSIGSSPQAVDFLGNRLLTPKIYGLFKIKQDVKVHSLKKIEET